MESTFESNFEVLAFFKREREANFFGAHIWEWKIPTRHLVLLKKINFSQFEVISVDRFSSLVKKSLKKSFNNVSFRANIILVHYYYVEGEVERGVLANGTLICIMKQFIGFSIPVTKALIIAIISYNPGVAIFLLTSTKNVKILDQLIINTTHCGLSSD